MPLPPRKQQPLRLTPDQAARVEKAAQKSGQTVQAFMLSAVVAKVEEWEHKREARKEARLRRDARPEPQGLGIRPRAAAVDAQASAEAGAPATQSVVVNVGQGKDGGLVQSLAAYVKTGGPAYNEDTRMRTAVDILKASTPSEEERERLARDLDAALSRPKERQSLSARLGLDQIKELFT